MGVPPVGLFRIAGVSKAVDSATTGINLRGARQTRQNFYSFAYCPQWELEGDIFKFYIFVTEFFIILLTCVQLQLKIDEKYTMWNYRLLVADGKV